MDLLIILTRFSRSSSECRRLGVLEGLEECLVGCTSTLERILALSALLSASIFSARIRSGDFSGSLVSTLCFLGLLSGRSRCSDEAFRLRNDRDPSRGSSSRMRVLNTEWEPGRDAPRCAGSRSRVNLEVDDLRLALLAS